MRILAPLVLVATLGAAPLGTAAPPIVGTALSGTPIAARPGAGKVTVLNFWATWCPPCRAETADLVAAYAKLHAPDVVFLGIDTTETAPIVKTFLSAKGVPYPTMLAGPDVYNAFGIAYIPTTVVLDARGVVRARWIGGVSPGRLAQYVAAARAGRSIEYLSPLQQQIDRSLALERFRFAGSPAAIERQIAQMKAAIARAEQLADAHPQAVNYERTQSDEAALQIAAGTALPHSVTGLTLIAQGKGAENQWTAAARAYRAALALTPDAPKLVAALGRAYYRLHDYPAMIALAQRYTQLEPSDGDGWSDLGLAYQRTKQFSGAVPAYEQSLTLLKADAAKHPTQDAIADVADTSLDLADVYVSLGDATNAARVFAQANAYGNQLAANGEYADLKRNVKERTQEGTIAVALAEGNGKPVVSVTPWTGPDLPGSVDSTLKYRLIVAAAADSDVTLRAAGLGKDWIASFCADGLCSPQRVSFKAPSSGVKTYEFQLVPPAPGAKPGPVAIAVRGGSTVSVPPIR